MSGIWFFNVRRSWEDWLTVLLGVVIGLSPWLAEQQHDQAVMWNAVLVGVLVLGFAQLKYVSLRRWQEIGEIACGLWLIASPFTLATRKPACSSIGISPLAHRCAACCAGALAGLDAERQGTGPARAIANGDSS